MTQRDWIVTLALGLGAALLPGCFGTQGRTDSRAAQLVYEKPPPDPPDSPSDSPYHAWLPTKPAELAPPPPPDRIEKVGYSKGRADQTLHVAGEVPSEPSPLGSQPPAAPPPLLLQSHDSSPPPDEPVVGALRCLLHQHPDEALRCLKKYDAPNQEVLLQLLPWVARVAAGSLDRAHPEEVAVLLQQVDDLERSLRSRATLTIGRLCFVRTIEGYGVYEPLPDNHVFQSSGEEGELVTLYAEVRNFSSRPVGPVHETRLSGRVEIRDAAGVVEWMRDYPGEPEHSRSPRHDYFISIAFRLPANLPPGRHLLVVMVRDLTGYEDKTTVPRHRVARQEVWFDVSTGASARGVVSETAPAPSSGGS
jgi:hypothetical protein